jgi:hypothetical protein
MRFTINSRIQPKIKTNSLACILQSVGFVGLTIDVAVILQNKCELTLKRNSMKTRDGLSSGEGEKEGGY